LLFLLEDAALGIALTLEDTQALVLHLIDEGVDELSANALGALTCKLLEQGGLTLSVSRLKAADARSEVSLPIRIGFRRR